MLYLTLLSLLSILFASAILYIKLKNKEYSEIFHYFVIGIFSALTDFLVEFLGTTTSHWAYHESLYFIFGRIPIELPILFFSAGVIARYIFLETRKMKFPLTANKMLYILILLTFTLYVRELYLEQKASMLPLAVVIGIWGIINLSEKNKESAILLATLAAISDWVFETVIINSGSYNYKNGFSTTIPVIYSMLTLGFLALMERMHKLDEFLDSPIIKWILHIFGVYRNKFKYKFREKINELKNKF